MGDPFKRKAFRTLTLMHHAAVHQMNILTMRHHGDILPRRILHGLAIDLGVHDTLAILGHGDHPRRLHAGIIRSLLAQLTFGHGADLMDLDTADRRSLILHQADHLRAVRHGLGVGHGKDRGKAATGRGRHTGLHGFLLRLSGLAQMHVQIDQTGHHETIRGVDDLSALRFRFASGQILHFFSHAYGIRSNKKSRNLPITDQKVSHLIPMACRIDQSTILNIQHAAFLPRLAG